MPKIVYRKKRFSTSVLETIQKVNDILDEYEKDGIDLTVRQVYYQFVARDDGRMAGLIDSAEGQDIHVIHLGDHDPSGIDMSRDIQDRLNLFAPEASIEVHRIALNMDQVEKYNPPPNPAKLTDSRCGGYISKFGDESWELDALEPRVVRDLISNLIGDLREMDAWEKAQEEEDAHKSELRKISDRYEDVAKFVSKRGKS